MSSNNGLATVSSGGLVTAVASGTVTIAATYQGRAASASVTMSFVSSTRNTMTASIDGAPFNAIVVSSLRSSIPSLPSGLLAIGGTSGFTSPYLVLAVAIPAAVGTYQLGPGTVPNGGLRQNSATASLAWDTTVAGGSGTVTLTTLTATQATGTFSLTVVPNGGVGGTPTGTKVITNGAFSVTF